MTTIPIVSGAEIAARVGEQSFRRGLGYFRNHALFNFRREASTIRAQCQGSGDAPYRLEVTFGEHGISAAECTCPVGHGGFCKHIAALLLAWEANPNDFVEVEELNQALDRRTRLELIALIKQMLRRAPELESLLELPLPTGEPRDRPASAEAFRRQAATAFADADPGEWGVEADVATKLVTLLELATDFAAQHDAVSAAAVDQGVATEVLANYERFPNDEGDLSGVVETCVADLVALLDQPANDATARLAVLHALVAIHHEGVMSNPESSLVDDIPRSVVGHATPDERATIAGWVREAIARDGESPVDDEDVPSGESFLADAYRNFLFDLEADTLDDEEFIRKCRALDRPIELVGRLLARGRVDEATIETRPAPDHILLQLAERFVEAGRGDVAERLLVERAHLSAAPPILAWLSERYAARGDNAPALELAERVFTLTPSLESYRRARNLAQKLGRWETTRAGLRTILNQPSHRYLLVDVYLDDGDLDRAIDAVTARTSSTGASAGADPYDVGYGLTLKVARAAEATRPRAAIEIYRERAEHLIEQRGRGNYQSASELLRKVRDLYRRLGDEDSWRTEIANLREKHRTLPALHDELARAGL